MKVILFSSSFEKVLEWTQRLFRVLTRKRSLRNLSATHLASKLVAWKHENPQSLRLCKFIIQSLELLVVLVCEATLTGNVNNDTNMASKISKNHHYVTYVYIYLHLQVLTEHTISSNNYRPPGIEKKYLFRPNWYPKLSNYSKYHHIFIFTTIFWVWYSFWVHVYV